MTDILWYSTEIDEMWGEYREVEKLPWRVRAYRWWRAKFGERYVVGFAWPEKTDRSDPEPLWEAAFGEVAPTQRWVITMLQIRGAYGRQYLGVGAQYERLKLVTREKMESTRPTYEISQARPTKGGFQAIYTPVDE